MRALTECTIAVFVIGMVFCVEAYGNKTDEGVLGSWKFDEDSGSVASDSSGNGNDGTVYGATWTTGNIGNALSFDGIDDWVDIPDDISPEHITLEAWIYPTGVYDVGDHGSPIITKETGRGTPPWSESFAWRLRITPHTHKLQLQCFTPTGAGGGSAVSDTILQMGEWYHVAGTYDGTETRVYIDGNLEGGYTTPISEPLVTSNLPTGIGHLPNWSVQWYQGIIDELRVYGRALASEEIAKHAWGAVFSAAEIIAEVISDLEKIAGGENIINEHLFPIEQSIVDRNYIYISEQNGALTGLTVFQKLEKALNEIAELDSSLVNIQKNIVLAAYVLAETLVDELEKVKFTNEAAEGHYAKAIEYLEEALEEERPGDKIDNFKNAWSAATEALEEEFGIISGIATLGITTSEEVILEKAYTAASGSTTITSGTSREITFNPPFSLEWFVVKEVYVYVHAHLEENEELNGHVVVTAGITGIYSEGEFVAVGSDRLEYWHLITLLVGSPPVIPSVLGNIEVTLSAKNGDIEISEVMVITKGTFGIVPL